MSRELLEMLPHYQIRPARSMDLAARTAIERAAAALFAPGHLPDDDVTSMEALERGQADGLLWVAACGPELVGSALAQVQDDALHLAEMSVHPDHGRRGLGTRLVRTVLDEAIRRRLSAVTLTTFADLAWNGPFYARLGFRSVGASELTPFLAATLERERQLGSPHESRCAWRYTPQTLTASRLVIRRAACADAKSSG